MTTHECERVSVQLHFIESYLHESDRGFDNLSEEDQMKLKEQLYVEVNRWAQVMTQREKGSNRKCFTMGLCVCDL